MKQRFQKNAVFIKFTFLISKTRQIYAKSLSIPESTLKMKVMAGWTLSKSLLTSAAICKERLLHENKIMKYPEKL